MIGLLKSLDFRQSSALWVIGAGVGSAIVTLVGFRFIGTAVGANSYGEASLWYGVALLLSGVVAGPVSQAVGKFWFDTENSRERASIFITALSLLAAATAALVALTWFVAALDVRLTSRHPAYLYPTIVGAFIAEASKSLAIAWLTTQSRFRHVALIQLLEAAARPVLVVALFGMLRDGTQSMLLGYLGSAAFAALVAVQLCLSSLRWVLPSLGLAGRIFWFGLPLTANGLFGWLSNTGDRYLVAAALGTQAAGIYVAATAFGGRLATMLGAMIETYFRPTLYASLATREPLSLKSVCSRWRRSQLVWGISLLVCLLGVLPVLVLAWFPPDFRQGAALLVPASFVAFWLITWSYLPQRINYGLGHTGKVAAVEVCGTIVMSLMVVGLGHLLGQFGVGLGLIVAALVRTWVANYLARQSLRDAGMAIRY